MSTATLLANQLHIIGETKYKEFQIINNFWKQQHDFIQQWEAAHKKMNEVFTKEAQIIETTFYSNYAGFLPTEGETIITAISYIGNIAQLLCTRTTTLFRSVLDNLDVKFKAIEKEFKSVGYNSRLKQKDVVNETIIIICHFIICNIICCQI